MKKLTGLAALIAVPTAITGCYRQNVPLCDVRSQNGSMPGQLNPVSEESSVTDVLAAVQLPEAAAAIR
jgi:hypothetical protein